MLARAFLEREINTAYLVVCDDHAYDGFLQHEVQRDYRDGERTVGPPGLQVHVRRSRRPEDPGEIPGLLEALERFTSRRGRPKNWTDLTIDQRIATVATEVPTCVPETLVIGKALIYERASEALHGSLRGLRQFSEREGVTPKHGELHFWDRQTEELVALYVVLSRTIGTTLWVLQARADSLQVQRHVARAISELHTFYEELADSPSEE
jgi:hypothetical protein